LIVLQYSILHSTMRHTSLHFFPFISCSSTSLASLVPHSFTQMHAHTHTHTVSTSLEEAPRVKVTINLIS